MSGKQMNRILITSRLFLWSFVFVAVNAIISPAYSGTQATISVSLASGNDANNGSATAPVKSIQRARDIVRGMTASMTGDIVISIKNGRYYLPSTFMLGDADSGKNGHRVIYQSAPNEKASISGGTQVAGTWVAVGGGIYKTNVGAERFRQLYVNGQRAIRARNPDSGYVLTTRFNATANTIVINNSLIPAVANLNQVEMVLHKEWTQSNYLISSVSRSGTEATLSFLNAATLSFSTLLESNQRAFFLENAREFLNSPGEWYLNTSTNELFYMPRSGENMASVEVIVPKIENMVNVQSAHDITFYGLIFEHSNWTAPSNGGLYARQGSRVQVGTVGGVIPSAINIKDSSRINFERNLVRFTGGIGLGLVSGVNNSNIIGNVFRETAASGIAVDRAMGWGVYKGGPLALTSQQCQNIAIKNNFVTKTGLDYASSEAIFTGYAGYMTIEHNLVKDVPYVGISAGWGWSAVDQPQKNFSIRYNRIDHAMGNMSDGGAIYTLSKNPGTVIGENHILNMTKGPGAGSNPFGHSFVGIYLDEGSSYITVRNNVYDNIAAPGYNLYTQMKFSSTATGASYNTIYNNYGPVGGSTSGYNNSFLTDSSFNAATVRANAGIEAAYADIINETVVNPPPPNDKSTPSPPTNLRVSAASSSQINLFCSGANQNFFQIL